MSDVLKERPTWRKGGRTRNGIGEGAAASSMREPKVGPSALLKPGLG